MSFSFEELVLLTTQEVIVLHDMSIKKYGGRSGILNYGNLDSAVGRVKTAMSYEDTPDPIKAACLYAHAVSRSHGFNDGNKRAAYAAMSTCLAINGFVISGVDPEDMAQRIIDLATRLTPIEEFELFIRDVARPDSTYQFIKDMDLPALEVAVGEADDTSATDVPAP